MPAPDTGLSSRRLLGMNSGNPEKKEWSCFFGFIAQKKAGEGSNVGQNPQMRFNAARQCAEVVAPF